MHLNLEEKNIKYVNIFKTQSMPNLQWLRLKGFHISSQFQWPVTLKFLQLNNTRIHNLKPYSYRH